MLSTRLTSTTTPTTVAGAIPLASAESCMATTARQDPLVQLIGAYQANPLSTDRRAPQDTAQITALRQAMLTAGSAALGENGRVNEDIINGLTADSASTARELADYTRHFRLSTVKASTLAMTDETSELARLRYELARSIRAKLKQRQPASLLEVMLLQGMQWEISPGGYYNKGLVPPRDRAAWQAPVVAAFRALQQAAAKDANRGELADWYAKIFLLYVDLGFEECTRLKQMLQAARLEEQHRTKNKKNPGATPPFAHKSAVTQSAWWSEVVFFHGDGLAEKSSPISDYLASLIPDLDLPSHHLVLTELLNPQNTGLEFWRERARELDRRREFDPTASSPILEADWLTETEKRLSHRELAVSGLADRLETLNRSSRLFYPVPEGARAVQNLTADKSRDSQLFSGFAEGRWLMFSHAGFQTRFFAPAEAFDVHGRVKPEYVAILPLLPGGTTQHSNINALMYTASVFAQPLTDLDGNVWLTPEGEPARLLPIGFDHAFAHGGPKDHALYDMDVGQAWFRSVFDYLGAAFPDLSQIAIGRSMGANYLDEHLARRVGDGPLDGIIRFGTESPAWAAYSLKHLFRLDPTIAFYQNKDGSVAAPNLEQIKLALALDGLIHPGSPGADLLDPDVPLTMERITAELLDTMMRAQKPQWTFMNDANYHDRLKALLELDRDSGKKFSHPDVHYGAPLSLEEVFDLDWLALSQKPAAWRAVHDYFRELRWMAGLPEAQVPNLLKYGVLDEEYPRAEARALWPRFAAATGAFAYFFNGGHDPYDDRRTDDKAVTEHARKVSMQFMLDIIRRDRARRGVPALTA